MDTVTSRQLGFGIFTALAAPLCVCCAELPWPAALLGLSLSGLGYYIVYSGLHSGAAFGARTPLAFRGALLFWILLLMAKTASLSRACFQDSTGFIPLVLLGMAAVTARHGAEPAGRIAAVLWSVIAAILLGLLCASLSDFSWEKAAAARGGSEEWTIAAVLGLAPISLMILARPEDRGRGIRPACWLTLCLGFVTSVVSCGVLGSLRNVLPQPFLDMVRGVSILGTPARLEALLSAVLCIGYYMALSLLCAAGCAAVRPLLTEKESKGCSWGIAFSAAALYIPIEKVPAELWLIAALLMGIGAPLGLLCVREKNEEIAKKST